MSLNIKNVETYRLVKELADETGESMTAAVTEAVRERLDRGRAERGDNRGARLPRARALLAAGRGGEGRGGGAGGRGGGRVLRPGLRRAALRRNGPPEVIVDTSAIVAM